jgi:hypothetical protein
MAAAIGKPRISDYIERFTDVFRPERGQASETGPGWYTALAIFITVCFYFVLKQKSLGWAMLLIHWSVQRQGAVDRCVGRYFGDGGYSNKPVNSRFDFGSVKLYYGDNWSEIVVGKFLFFL